jgi:DNA-binding IscR family transcriptional regulator
MLSQTGLYALQAVLRLAERGDAKTSASALAEELGIPRNYLAKVLHASPARGCSDPAAGPEEDTA